MAPAVRGNRLEAVAIVKECLRKGASCHYLDIDEDVEVMCESA
jgi:hypothetical protein